MAPLSGRRRLLRGAAVLATLPAWGVACSLMQRPARLPMPVSGLLGPAWAADTEKDRAVSVCAGPAPVLLVLLPGAYSAPLDFIAEGFVQLLQDSGIKADAVVADAHLGYFANRSVLQRLREDVVGPSRARGYAQVWLIGISLGGFGALAYAATHDGSPQTRVDGVLALAPYLGETALLNEIEQAGGLAAWAASATAHSAKPVEADGGFDASLRELWRWLAAPPPGAPPVFMGFGTQDRLAQGHRLLAAQLPPQRVLEVAGDHDWPPWRQLWKAWLASAPLPRSCLPLAGN